MRPDRHLAGPLAQRVPNAPGAPVARVNADLWHRRCISYTECSLWTWLAAGLQAAGWRAERRFALMLQSRSVTASETVWPGTVGRWPPGGCGRQAESLPARGLPGGPRDICGDNIGGMPVQAAAGPVVPHCGPRIGMGGSLLDIAQRDPGIETGRERFTNHAEWVSVTTSRWWHLPSSLRFFVAFTARFLRLMQRE